MSIDILEITPQDIQIDSSGVWYGRVKWDENEAEWFAFVKSADGYIFLLNSGLNKDDLVRQVVDAVMRNLTLGQWANELGRELIGC